MSALPGPGDRALADQLAHVAALLGPLLRRRVPDRWAPGLRRPAVLSDLFRALDGTWPTNGTTAQDPWSVPNGYPAGGEHWPTRRTAGAWLGVDRVAALTDLIPTPVDGDTGPWPTDLLPHHNVPLAIWSRHWPASPTSHGPGRWLELGALTQHLGTDGPRSLLAINATWRVPDTSTGPGDAPPAPDPESAPQPGRDGLLLITPTALAPAGGRAGLAAFVHLLAQPTPGTGLDRVVAQGRAHLLARWADRSRRGEQTPDPAGATPPAPTSAEGPC